MKPVQGSIAGFADGGLNNHPERMGSGNEIQYPAGRVSMLMEGIKESVLALNEGDKRMRAIYHQMPDASKGLNGPAVRKSMKDIEEEMSTNRRDIE